MKQGLIILGAIMICIMLLLFGCELEEKAIAYQYTGKITRAYTVPYDDEQGIEHVGYYLVIGPRSHQVTWEQYCGWSEEIGIVVCITVYVDDTKKIEEGGS